MLVSFPGRNRVQVYYGLTSGGYSNSRILLSTTFDSRIVVGDLEEDEDVGYIVRLEKRKSANHGSSGGFDLVPTHKFTASQGVGVQVLSADFLNN